MQEKHLCECACVCVCVCVSVCVSARVEIHIANEAHCSSRLILLCCPIGLLRKPSANNDFCCEYHKEKVEQEKAQQQHSNDHETPSVVCRGRCAVCRDR